MNTKRLYGTIALALLAGLLLGRFLFPPGPAAHDGHAHAEAGAPADTAATTWTCSMHPQIKQPGPGKCPICGMDLIPLETGTADDEGSRTLSMSESAVGLADIRTTAIERRLPTAEVQLVGKLDYDETRLRSLTARFPARIDELFVNYTGIPVNQGDHLARVYSPELLTAQRELLTALTAGGPDSSFARVAREKLRLWGLQAGQIDEVVAAGEPSEDFELRAPMGGVVIEKNVKEGDYVQTGSPLFRIADLTELWLHLSAFESDLPWLRFGQDVAFTVEAFPGEEFHGRVAFISPEVDRQTRTTAIRVNVPNRDRRLKPGMLARGRVRVLLAENGEVIVPELAGKWIGPMHPEIIRDEAGDCPVCGMPLVPASELGYADPSTGEAPLVVPASAVLLTGRRAVVYVAVPGRDRPTFEGREVVLGPKAGDVYLVRSGLAEGERVVTSGAFKIDSALQIVAKPSMMNPAEQEAQDEAIASSPDTPIEIEADLATKILPAYFDLQAALAADDLDAAQAALRTMMEQTGHQGPLPDLVHAMLGAEDLDTIRRPHFETLSNTLIAAVKADPARFTGDIHLMHCPMVYEDRGADWLQPTEDLRNPYFGAMMLTCGELRGLINQAN